MISRIHPHKLCKLAAISRHGKAVIVQKQHLKAWLTAQQIAFVDDARGWPLVLESALEARLSPPTATTPAKHEWAVNLEGL